MIRFVDFIRRFTMICSIGLTVMAVHPPVAVAVGRTPAMASTPVRGGNALRAAVVGHAATTGSTTVRAGYTLQVAALSSRSEAEELAAGIAGAWVQEVRQNDRPIFRVNYGRFDERAQAVRAQWTLEDQGYKSFIQQLFT